MRGAKWYALSGSGTFGIWKNALYVLSGMTYKYTYLGFFCSFLVACVCRSRLIDSALNRGSRWLRWLG